MGDDGSIVAALSQGRLSRVPAAGGTPVTVLETTAESISPRWPQVLFGGRIVLFTAVGPRGPNAATIEALTVADGRRQLVVRGGTYGRVLPSGHLIYVNQGTLFALPLDLNRLDARGAPVPILDRVAYSATFGFAQIDFARTGALVYRRDEGAGRSLAWIDSSGGIERLPMKPASYLWPRLSPSGDLVAMTSIESGRSTVWI